ncbi:hypothetical protein ACLB2K_076461 [Fragaria x ananassa]
MVRAGVQPDHITFTGLLSGCSHSGLVNVGLKYFDGRLMEAMDVVDKMPMQAGPSIWGALLSACRNHPNLEIAETAARNLFILEPDNSGNYVVLSNIYAEAGMWTEVDKLRILLKSQGMKKSPGCSWIEVNGKAHLFLGGDTSHPQAKEV